MIEKFHCELDYVGRPHLNQLYVGFLNLKKLGLITLKINNSSPFDKAFLRVRINNKYTIIYDMKDGLNWINGTDEENFQYFKDKFNNVDYYFKRSYHPILLKNSPQNCKVYPLGLFYRMALPAEYSFSIGKKYLKYLRKDVHIGPEAFEKYPILPSEIKVIHFAHLWNPDDISDESLKTERIEMNRLRIGIIKACKTELGDMFIGGLSDNPFTRKMAPDLILPKKMTNRRSYLKTVWNASICIATNGLHQSIGGRIGEYVAASRAILTEPLAFEVPGNFQKDKNYIEFTSLDQMICIISQLVHNKNRIHEIMLNNYRYYNNYLKPENLVLNSLSQIH